MGGESARKGESAGSSGLGDPPAERVSPGALSADAPITEKAQDELGRAAFAGSLASDIRRAPRDSGFVVALTGPWGAGKTSVLRLIEGELTDQVTAVVSFNPWLFSGTEQLVEHFFAELAGQLEAKGGVKLSKVTKALRGYGRVVSPLRYLPYVGEIARATSEAASDLSGALGGEETASAQVRAAKLKKRLAALELPVVVMVDDLDRLRPEEIVDVVRLVRLVGDFPNLVYVLAFDLPQVERALGESREEGRAYLDKIVHISHGLPAARPEDLNAVLTSALSDIIPDPEVYRFNQERNVNLFWTEVRPLFSTVRDVRRFANVLPSTLELLGEEVDLTDILALEAIRIFEPEAFEAILAARYALTGALSPLGGLDINRLTDKESKEDRELIRQIPAAAPRRSREIERIVAQLFPLAEPHLEGGASQRQSSPEWKRLRRVAHADVLDVYLQRRLAPGAIPTREVEEAVAALADRAQLEEIFSRRNDGELTELYGRLADFEGAFPDGAAESAINLIMARGVALSGGFNDISGSALITRLLRSLDPEQVAAVLARLTYPNLTRRLGILRTVGYREEGAGRMVTEGDSKELTGQLVEAVLERSVADLAGEEDLGPLILLLQREAPEALAARLPEWLKDDHFFVAIVFAHRLIGARGTAPDGSVETVVQLTWPPLLELIDLEQLRLRIEEIDPDWVRAEFSEETLVIWDQARYYADNPAAGEDDAGRWGYRRGGSS